MSDVPKKDPMERLADSFEAIASELASITRKIEEHTEAMGAAGQWISDSLDDVAAATRGEEKPEDD